MPRHDPGDPRLATSTDVTPRHVGKQNPSCGPMADIADGEFRNRTTESVVCLDTPRLGVPAPSRCLEQRHQLIVRKTWRPVPVSTESVPARYQRVDNRFLCRLDHRFKEGVQQPPRDELEAFVRCIWVPSTGVVAGQGACICGDV